MRRFPTGRRAMVAVTLVAAAAVACDQPTSEPSGPLRATAAPDGSPPDVSPAVAAGGPGRIIAFHDEWALADMSFEKATGSPQYARNVARFFAPGRPGRFLAWSDNVGLRGDSVAATLRAAGHTWVRSEDRTLTLEVLQRFDAVFVAGGIVPSADLLDAYVKSGGGVYVAGGTGESPGGSPQAEAAAWNAFLRRYGIEMAPAWDRASGVYGYTSGDSLLAGVSTMYEGFGSSVSLATPAVEGARLLQGRDDYGVVAVYAPAARPVAAFAAPASLVEGDTLVLDASASANAASYAWTFEDGSRASGARVSRVAADDGTLRATLVVTSRGGAADTLVRSVAVRNATPVVSLAPLARVTSGASLAPSASFGDRGVRDATWKARVAWSDLPARRRDLAATGGVDASRQLCGAGVRTLTVAVTDKDGATGEATTSVEVAPVAIGIDVQPGDAVGSIKLGPQGPAELPVVVYGSSSLDVRTLDVGALRLGDGRGTGTPVATRTNGTRFATYADENRDGVADLVLKFLRRDLIANGDLSAATTALSLWGTSGGCAAVGGSDVVRVIP